MNHANQNLQIRIHKVDGSVVSFTQSGASLVNRILNELHPACIFNQEKIAITGNHSVSTFIPSLITRVDLVTDRFSVWDFPFVIGALLELTETEFHEFLHERQQRVQPRLSGDFPMSLEIEMVNGQRAFLWMEVISGFPADLLLRAYSLLKKRSLIFGLSTRGIGILNPANIVRFTVHPDPLKGPAESWSTHQVYGSKFEPYVKDWHRSMDDKQPLSRFSQKSRTNLTPSKMESK
jgi:hypothetical protein